MIRAASFATALVLAGTIAGVAPAAGGATDTVTHRSALHPRIVIKNFGYTGDLVVRPGVRVRVVNRDSVRHTLTDKVGGRFDTGPIPPNGGRAHFRSPRKVGSYPFGCRFHPEMKGTLVVRRA